MERHSRNCLAPSSGVPCCFVFVCVCVPGVRVLCSCVLGVWATHLACGPRNCWCLTTVQGTVCIIATPSDVLPHPWFNHSTCQAFDSRRTPPKHSCTCLVVQQRVPRAVMPACSVMLNCVVTSLCAVFVVLHISRGWRLAQPARSLHALPGAHLRLLYATRHVPQATNLCCCNSMLQHYWVAD